MVPTLQQSVLHLVPTKKIIQHNLIHLLGYNHRFIQDIVIHPTGHIDDYFFSILLDPGNTSFFWMIKFMNKQIHRLRLNEAILACWQEHYTDETSLVVFAMRTDWCKVMMFIYTIDKKKQKNITNNIFKQKKTHKWTEKDWRFVSTLTFEKMFYISSDYEKN